MDSKMKKKKTEKSLKTFLHYRMVEKWFVKALKVEYL